MKDKDICEILTKEIQWCRKDKEHRTKSPDWHSGFIEGLKQARLIIKKVRTL